jgi:hypothetical protein
MDGRYVALPSVTLARNLAGPEPAQVNAVTVFRVNQDTHLIEEVRAFWGLTDLSPNAA